MPPIDPKKLTARIDGQRYTYSELRILALLAEAEGVIQQGRIVELTGIASGTVSEKSRALMRKGLVQLDRRGVECTDKTRAGKILAQVDFGDVEDKLKEAWSPKKRGLLSTSKHNLKVRQPEIPAPLPAPKGGRGRQTKKVSGPAIKLSVEEVEVIQLLLEAKRPIALHDLRLATNGRALKALPHLDEKGLVSITWRGRSKYYECKNTRAVNLILRQWKNFSG